MKRIFLITFLSLLGAVCYAQSDSTAAKGRWEYFFGFETNLLRGNVMSNPRVSADNNIFKYRFEVARFFTNRLGVYGVLSLGSIEREPKLTPFHNIPEENLVKISTSENSIHAGVVAKFTFGKFELHPMLGIGVGRRISSDMRLDYYNGSNTDIVQYNVNYGSRWAPFLAPGVKATFRTGRNFMLYAGLEYD